jgi:hypothetical protein
VTHNDQAAASVPWITKEIRVRHHGGGALECTQQLLVPRRILLAGHVHRRELGSVSLIQVLGVRKMVLLSDVELIGAPQ